MPTADEKPVYIRTKPFTYCKSEPTCQDGVNISRGGFLLLNFEPPYRDNLAFSLRLHRRKVIVPEELGKTYADLTNNEILNADYIFCDLTRKIKHDDFQKLRGICTLRQIDGMPILTACWLLEAADPGFQLSVEILFGARIVLCKTALNP